MHEHCSKSHVFHRLRLTLGVRIPPCAPHRRERAAPTSPGRVPPIPPPPPVSESALYQKMPSGTGSTRRRGWAPQDGGRPSRTTSPFTRAGEGGSDVAVFSGRLRDTTLREDGDGNCLATWQPREDRRKRAAPGYSWQIYIDRCPFRYRPLGNPPGARSFGGRSPNRTRTRFGESTTHRPRMVAAGISPRVSAARWATKRHTLRRWRRSGRACRRQRQTGIRLDDAGPTLEGARSLAVRGGWTIQMCRWRSVVDRDCAPRCRLRGSRASTNSLRALRPSGLSPASGATHRKCPNI